jgi:membrane protease YdiL (CAAX protease family)
MRSLHPCQHTREVHVPLRPETLSSPQIAHDASSSVRLGLRAPRGLAAIALCYLLADFLLVSSAPSWFHGSAISAFQWNWAGKSLEIVLACTLLAASPWLRRNTGLRWRQAPGSLPLSLLCFAACVAIGSYLGSTGRPKPFNIETLLFQASMPSITEELSFRGITLALLDRAFGNDPMACRLRLGWAAVIVTIIFALAHALSFQQGALAFNLLPFAVTTATGIIFVLARTRSGSLAWPMMCHCAVNLSLFAVAWAR